MDSAVDQHDHGSDSEVTDLGMADSTQRQEAHRYHLTLRALVVGLIIGIVVCVSNIYFCLQTGWGSGMMMPSALLGYSAFKIMGPHLNTPFTPEENVLIQTVAGATGTLPMASGFAGVFPALEYVLSPGEGGPMTLGLSKLILWSLGTCLVGTFFSPLLRSYILSREKLIFPGASATAYFIAFLHGTRVENGEHRRAEDELRASEGIGLLRFDSDTEDNDDYGDTTDDHSTGSIQGCAPFAANKYQPMHAASSISLLYASLASGIFV